jgi:hypothetical protein
LAPTPYNYPALLRHWKAVPLFQPFTKHSTRTSCQKRALLGFQPLTIRPTFLTTETQSRQMAKATKLRPASARLQQTGTGIALAGAAKICFQYQTVFSHTQPSLQTFLLLRAVGASKDWQRLIQCLSVSIHKYSRRALDFIGCR